MRTSVCGHVYRLRRADLDDDDGVLRMLGRAVGVRGATRVDGERLALRLGW